MPLLKLVSLGGLRLGLPGSGKMKGNSMTGFGPRSHKYEINAMLRVSKRSEDRIRDFFTEHYNIKRGRFRSGLHLTVYHGRRPLPGLQPETKPAQITASTSETHFMPLVPGGENPRDDIDVRVHPVGIRLTKRNLAIPEIQKLREQMYRLETKIVVGKRKPTTAWTNCFGSRKYQPHIEFLRRWHKTKTSLPEIGSHFKNEIDHIEFDQFQIEERHRVDGKWIVGSPVEPPRNTVQALTDVEASRLWQLFNEDYRPSQA